MHAETAGGVGLWHVPGQCAQVSFVAVDFVHHYFRAEHASGDERGNNDGEGSRGAVQGQSEKHKSCYAWTLRIVNTRLE